ncbi:unnamed protein product [Owenia fusiformis]|uniref:Uncharacterized protein n=1 Tax=Owenia fusiformis TaxID=6347 RepID=A0A8J1Y6Y7_OWEFU|nr:unnamed protein product [Owenia fusiformis]
MGSACKKPQELPPINMKQNVGEEQERWIARVKISRTEDMEDDQRAQISPTKDEESVIQKWKKTLYGIKVINASQTDNDDDDDDDDNDDTFSEIDGLNNSENYNSKGIPKGVTSAWGSDPNFKLRKIEVDEGSNKVTFLGSITQNETSNCVPSRKVITQTNSKLKNKALITQSVTLVESSSIFLDRVMKQDSKNSRSESLEGTECMLPGAITASEARRSKSTTQIPIIINNPTSEHGMHVKKESLAPGTLLPRCATLIELPPVLYESLDKTEGDSTGSRSSDRTSNNPESTTYD